MAHDQFEAMPVQDFHTLGKEKHVFYDLKYLLDQNDADIHL